MRKEFLSSSRSKNSRKIFITTATIQIFIEIIDLLKRQRFKLIQISLPENTFRKTKYNARKNEKMEKEQGKASYIQ